MSEKYYAELEPDARGFRTFLEVEVSEGKIVSAWLDAKNENENPYGTYKSTSEKYNDDMHSESGTYYRDASASLERDILNGVSPLTKVKGARFLSQDANELFNKIKDELKTK